MMEEEDGDHDREDGVIPLGNVSKVKQSWQVHEDFGLAYRMQNNEFSEHYDKNRCERRLMHTDICLTKEEQQAEDGYAAAYYEQLRRDQMKEDERLALELQKRLDEEERQQQEARVAKEREDRMLAERLQSLEVDSKGSPGSKKAISASRSATAATAKGSMVDVGDQVMTKSPSGDRLVLPPGMTPELLKALEEASASEPIALPPGLSLEQYDVLQKATLEEDRRLAEEVQDYELARFVASKGKPIQPNCVKPSRLLALTKEKKPSSSVNNGKLSASGDRSDQYSVISKKSKKFSSHGSANDRHSAKGHSTQKWERFE